VSSILSYVWLANLSVLNPVIRMAWIENKWATVYINQAVNIIKTTVGLANFIEKQLLI
jgi:hypothetical protein